MANKKVATISIWFCIVAFVLTLVSFYTENWVIFETSEEERQFGLFRQTDGFDKDIVASWYWQSVFYCEAKDEYSGEETLENVAQAWCDVGTRFWKSAIAYYICYLLSFFFLSKYIICCISILLDRDPGEKKFMIGYSSFFVILSVVAFSCWWGINDNVQYDANWQTDEFVEDSKNGEVFELCAGPGATLSIIAFISNVVAGVMGIVCACIQDDLNVIHVVQTAKIGCLSLRRHFVVIYVMSIMAIALSLTTPLIRTWVQFNITNTDWGRNEDYTGSLSTIDEFTSRYETQILQLDHYPWDCIGGASCETNHDGMLCKTFEPLAEAGRIYFNIQLTVTGLLLLWHNFFGYLLIFEREWSHPRLINFLPNAAWILHLVAVICWAVVSEVKFEMGDCENENTSPDEKLDVWISNGPILAILQLVLQFITAAYFKFIYRWSKESGISDIVLDWPESSKINDTFDSNTTMIRPKQLLTDPKRMQLLPLNFPTVSTILIVDDANSAVPLYVQAFSGDVMDKIEHSDRIYYAEIKIGVSYIIIKDVNASEPKKFTSPKHISTTGEVYIEFGNCDSLYAKCKKLGFSDKFQVRTEQVQPEYLENLKYRIECPFGHIFTFIEKKPTFLLSQFPQIKCKPYIIVSNASISLELYKKVFKSEMYEMTENQGRVVHAAINIGTSLLYVGEQGAQMDIKSPQSLGNTTMEVMIAIIAFEQQYDRCMKYGFKSLQNAYSTPLGNRYAKVEDPFGHIWNLQAKDDIWDEDNIKLGWRWKTG